MIARVVIESVAHGGLGVGRIDGKTVFVEGAVPGDTAMVELVADKRRYARAAVVELVEPAPFRLPAPCPHFRECGGCRWQCAPIDVQLEWKREIVRSQLLHLAGLDPDLVRSTHPVGPPYHYRNRMDFRVHAGRPALHAVGSHELVELDECGLLYPSLSGLFAQLGDLSGVKRVTLRAGVNTGELAIVVAGPMPPQAPQWSAAVGRAGSVRLRERVADVTFRISGRAFFQVNTAGAEALVTAVRTAAALEADDVLLDAYAGGGLFAATVGAGAGRVLAVESDRQAAEDLRHNVGEGVQVIESPLETALARLPAEWDVAVVDPPRAGLGRRVVAGIVAARPRTVVSVSCDPATFARDARLLVDRGYALEWVQPYDLFPQTAHVETVARFSL